MIKEYINKLTDENNECLKNLEKQMKDLMNDLASAEEWSESLQRESHSQTNIFSPRNFDAEIDQKIEKASNAIDKTKQQIEYVRDMIETHMKKKMEYQEMLGELLQSEKAETEAAVRGSDTDQDGKELEKPVDQPNQPHQVNMPEHANVQNHVNMPEQVNTLNQTNMQDQLNQPEQTNVLNQGNIKKQATLPEQMNVLSQVNMLNQPHQVNMPEQVNTLNQASMKNQLNQPEQVNTLNQTNMQDQLNQPEQINVLNQGNIKNKANLPEQMNALSQVNQPEQVNTLNQINMQDQLNQPKQTNVLNHANIQNQPNTSEQTNTLDRLNQLHQVETLNKRNQPNSPDHKKMPQKQIQDDVLALLKEMYKKVEHSLAFLNSDKNRCKRELNEIKQSIKKCVDEMSSRD